MAPRVGRPRHQVAREARCGRLFDLTAQILPLTYETFRKVAVKVWGKAAVELLETGAAAAEKGLEIVQIVREKRLAGLWELIQASLSSLVEELIQKVKKTVLFAAIDKALAFIACLFTPVGAFIKAAQAIYRGIRFLMDNIDRITEIVDAFLTSVELAVAGNTDAIAQKIVNALRGFIVVGIDFLAKLLGLGDLAGKVHKILNAIRAPFERAVEAVLKGLTTLVRAVMRKLGRGPRGEKEQPAQKRAAEERKKDGALAKEGAAGKTADEEGDRTEVGIHVPFVGGGESHEIFVEILGADAVVMIHSRGEDVADRPTDLDNEIASKAVYKERPSASSKRRIISIQKPGNGLRRRRRPSRRQLKPVRRQQKRRRA